MISLFSLVVLRSLVCLIVGSCRMSRGTTLELQRNVVKHHRWPTRINIVRTRLLCLCSIPSYYSPVMRDSCHLGLFNCTLA